MIFIIKGFWTIVFIFISIFHNVPDDMSSVLLHVFVELRILHRTSNYVIYWIHGVETPVLILLAIIGYKR